MSTLKWLLSVDIKKFPVFRFSMKSMFRLKGYCTQGIQGAYYFCFPSLFRDGEPQKRSTLEGGASFLLLQLQTSATSVWCSTWPVCSSSITKSASVTLYRFLRSALSERKKNTVYTMLFFFFTGSTTLQDRAETNWGHFLILRLETGITYEVAPLCDSSGRNVAHVFLLSSNLWSALFPLKATPCIHCVYIYFFYFVINQC